MAQGGVCRRSTWSKRILATLAVLGLAASGCAATPFSSSEPIDSQQLTCSVGAKLVPSCGVLWGIYTTRVAGQGWATPFLDIEQSIGRRLDLVKRYHDWSNAGGSGQFPDRYETQLGADGSRVLYFAWTSNIWSQGTFASWGDIADGVYDESVILPEAARIKAWGQPVFLDFDHEMDGRTRTANGTPAEYVAAYRHIREVMAAAGADNIIWAWVPTGTMANTARIKAMYPGDAYVDWVGYDPYNFYDCNGSSWETPYESLAPFYTWLANNGMGDKPVLLGEYGSVPDSSDPQRVADWYTGVSDALAQMPRIKAVIQWNSSTSSTCDFRVTGSPEAMSGFRSASLDPYINGSR